MKKHGLPATAELVAGSPIVAFNARKKIAVQKACPVGSRTAGNCFTIIQSCVR
jgi:hypothetical protein